MQLLHVHSCPAPFSTGLQVLAREAPKELPGLRFLRISLFPDGDNAGTFEDDLIAVMEGPCQLAGISWRLEKGEPVGVKGDDMFPGETMISPSFLYGRRKY